MVGLDAHSTTARFHRFRLVALVKPNPGICGDSGKENESYYSMLELYRNNGKENGSYYSGFRV